MKYVNKILIYLLVAICGIIYLILPSVVVSSITDGTQSGKSFFFLYLVIIMPVIILLKGINIKPTYVKISQSDLLLSAWIIYVIINGLFHKLSVSLLSLELYGLCLLYITLRKLFNENLIMLYALFIIGSATQAMYGNFQLWGYMPSNHNLFKITGSFFNPGPYGGYISIATTVTFGFYLLKNNYTHLIIQKYENQSRSIINIILQLFIAVMALALIASHSRAAFLSFLVSFIYLVCKRYNFNVKSFYKHSLIKKIGVTLLIFILTCFFFAGLYVVKRDSANGRLLIWEISLNMIKDKPIFGFGFNQFKSNYMDYQAKFFVENPKSNLLMVADDTNYAFNEPLQLILEHGIFGFFVVTTILLSLFTPRKYLQPVKQQNVASKLTKEESIFANTMVNIAKAGIINIFVFSLFSYPSEILPIKISFVLFIATVVNNKFWITFKINKLLIQIWKYIKPILILAFIVVSFSLIILLNNWVLAYKYWQDANQNYRFGAYETSLVNYQKAYTQLRNNGVFLTNYGKALFESRKYSKAILILEKGGKLYPNTIAYLALGDSYKALGIYHKAEQSYLYAWNMNPSRFYPKYLLAILYRDTKQIEKANIVAHELLKKNIKIESKAIKEMKEEMNEIIKTIGIKNEN